MDADWPGSHCPPAPHGVVKQSPAHASTLVHTYTHSIPLQWVKKLMLRNHKIDSKGMHAILDACRAHQGFLHLDLNQNADEPTSIAIAMHFEWRATELYSLKADVIGDKWGTHADCEAAVPIFFRITTPAVDQIKANKPHHNRCMPHAGPPFWAISGGCKLIISGPVWPFSGGCIFIISGHFGHFRAATFLLIFSILAVFGRLHFYYFRPFWPFSGGCIFIISGHFGRFRAAAFLLFLAILAVFGRPHFYFFFPFWPFSGGCIFIISGHFGRFRAAAFLLFLAILAVFGQLHFYCFFPFWPFSGGCIFIISGHFGRFRAATFLLFFLHFGRFRAAAFLLFPAILAVFGRLHFYYFRPFWPFSGGCIFIISGHFGRFRAAAFLLFPAILAVFGRLHFYCFWPFWLNVIINCPNTTLLVVLFCQAKVSLPTGQFPAGTGGQTAHGLFPGAIVASFGRYQETCIADVWDGLAGAVLCSLPEWAHFVRLEWTRKDEQGNEVSPQRKRQNQTFERALAACLRDAASPLQTLWVTQLNFDEPVETTAEWTKALGVTQSLRELRLGSLQSTGCDMNLEFVALLTQGLAQNETLKKLSLSNACNRGSLPEPRRLGMQAVFSLPLSHE